MANWVFNPFTDELDYSGSGGGAVVFEGEVATFADLPVTVGDPLVGAAYLVRESTGVWLVNRRVAGIYIRRNNAGLSTDWEYAGDYPVNSVNGQTGNVSLTASDVGVNFAAPPAIGNTTAAAGSFTNLTASAELQLPTNAPASPSVGDIYRVSDTLRYRDSSNTERLLLNASDNLSNLANTGTARTNLGLGTFATANAATPPAIGNTTPAAITGTTGTFSTLTANNGTQTTSVPVLDLAQTWNAAGVSFVGLRFDVTNTASATGSRVLHFTVGGTSNLLGIYRDAAGFPASPRFEIGSVGVTWNIRTRTDGGVGCNFDSIVGLGSSLQFGVGSGTTAGDLILQRDAANIFAQVNGTNAQEFRLYNTFTSATNHERGFLKWSSNVFQIGTEKGSGGGTARDLAFQTDGTTRMTLGATTGTLAINNGTVTTSTPAFTVEQTVNSAATVFSLATFRITSTASSVNSSILQCFDGATSILDVRRSGIVTGAGGISSANGFRAIGNGNSGGQVILTSNGHYCWNDSTTSTFGTQDLLLRRDAAGVLAQYNGLNGQAYRLYNSVSGTGNANFERANFRWASNEFIIDAEAGGTGTLRGIKIGSATSSLLGFYGATPVDRPATVADPAGGGTIDTEARTAINDIIDRLQELGLIA